MESNIILFRGDRTLLTRLAGEQRGAASRLLRRLLAEEAQRRGIEVTSKAKASKDGAREPERAA